MILRNNPGGVMPAEVRNLVVREAEMRAAGHTLEEIAIELHAARRALGQIYKDMTPPELLRKILQLQSGEIWR